MVSQANKPKKVWSPRKPRESLDENAHGQDPFSHMSIERPSLGASVQRKQVIKRVLLLGHTGAGKSTLFRTITSAYAPTSDAPVPCTVGIQRDSCQWRDTALECIDTPGFGDSREDMSNDRVLSEIAQFLKTEHIRGRKIHTVFYLIDVSKNKIDDSAKRQAKVFEALMGNEVWPNVCFIFTHGVSKYDVGPGAEHNQAKQLKFKKHLQKGILKSAKDGGALFCDLGLDFANYEARGPEGAYDSATETVTKDSQSLTDAKDTEDDLLELLSNSGDNRDDNMSDTGVQSDADSLLDVSKDEYHPVDATRVNAILQKMIDRPGPILLECQREMVDLDRPFRSTQAALLYESQQRDGLEATHVQEAQIAEERRAAEATQARMRQEKEELREQLRTAQEEREKSQRAREIEAEREKRREAERSRKAAEAHILAAKEAEQLVKQKTQEEQERKAQADAAEIEKDELRARLKSEEAARVEAEHRATEETKARQESERFRVEIEKRHREEEAARLEAEALRAKEEKVWEARERFKKEIKVIEESAGLASRFIIYNDTQVEIHVRARHTLLPMTGVIANYENNIGPGKFRAVHCGYGRYDFEVYMSTTANAFTTLGQVGAAIAYGTGSAAVLAVGGLLGGLLGPVGLAASAGLGAAWGALIIYVNNNDPEALDKDYTETGFESRFQDGEENSIMIASRPRESLFKHVELQMLVMEATRKGSSLCVATSEGFGLLKTTRLVVSGGPISAKLTRKDSADYMKYTFTKDTRPILVTRLSSFEEDD